MSYRTNTVQDPRDPCFKETNPTVSDIGNHIVNLFKKTEKESKFDILNEYMDKFTGKSSEQILNETLQNSGITPRDVAKLIARIAKEDKKSINYVLTEIEQGNESFLISSIARMAVLDIIIQELNQLGQKSEIAKIFNSTDSISKYLFSDLINYMK